MSREGRRRALSWLVVILLVSACCAIDMRREMDYKRIIYHYQDIREGIGDADSLWRDIVYLVGEPHEDYYYEIPRYSLFWEERKRR